MCRYDPITKTERRCPSYLDKASYNAKRRARYHAQKNSHVDNNIFSGFLKKKKHMEIESLPNIELKPVHPDFINELSVSDGFKEDKFFSATNEDIIIDYLNVKRTTCEGLLVDSGYFNSQKITGVIDNSSLNDKSYQAFFQSAEEQKFIRNNAPMVSDFDAFLVASKKELKDLTTDEKTAATFFTSGEFRWFNKAIYTQGYNLMAEIKGKPDSTVPSILDNEEYTSVSLDQRNRTNVLEMSNLLDNAIDKGPKIQRTLYRGISSDSSIFKGKKPAKWAKSLKIGQEMVFDSYQSATPDLDISSVYSTTEGVIFEILTPEGINVSSVSHFPSEKEVILPRGARYMVVGTHKKDVKQSYNKETVGVVQLVAINSKGEILDGTNSDKLKPVNLDKAFA